ncbi:MAG: ABC transporter substrate-binding protein [Planctomycetaceae bacterium]|jgi:ABC-type nitrate/sulfonate/bicarbonate transport system substrate-binding protein/outer membrane protein OmpA-like peptidoglycan-associated protein|nr:ABC transporter substrate-binding protein [Planctomycetaceae bacterium]
MTQAIRFLIVVSLALVAAPKSFAQELFSQLVGPIQVGPVESGPKASNKTVQVPYIFWGGDIATFLANGDLKTQQGSTYQQMGLDMQLVAGDDFVGQVRNYVSGKSPMLRGTMHMIGLAGEVLGADPRTKPVIVLQLSWSAGDHIVAKKGVKNLNELKGKKIACQQGGPHVGLLYDSLAAAGLGREDVEIVWTKDITGPDGPAVAFKNDASIDACCVVTPDMIGLTSGLDATGTGAEGTVEGAHVVNSTVQMSRSIADVYAVRRDWYDANKEWVSKFVAGHLKATEQLVAMRKAFGETGKMSKDYQQILNLSQRIFGKEVLPTLEGDVHGLLLDCGFVGLPGQIAFFKQKSNASGFEEVMSRSINLATQWKYAKARAGFEPNDFDYKKLAQLGGIEYVEPTSVERFNPSAESTEMFLGENLDANTIVSFSINFEPNEQSFSSDRYGAEFLRALKQASQFGNAAVVIRGHADPSKTLMDLIKAGIAKGIIQQNGTQGNYRYFMNGKPLDLSRTKEVVDLIKNGSFGGGNTDPAVTMQAALSLSQARAEAVKKSLEKFAKDSGITVDLSQIVPVGAGIMEPVIPKPRNIDEAKENMRVEFRIVKVNPEALTPTDFNF